MGQVRVSTFPDRLEDKLQFSRLARQGSLQRMHGSVPRHAFAPKRREILAHSCSALILIPLRRCILGDIHERQRLTCTGCTIAGPSLGLTS